MMDSSTKQAIRTAQTPGAQTYGDLTLVPDGPDVRGVYRYGMYLGLVELRAGWWGWSCGDCLSDSVHDYGHAGSAGALLGLHHQVEHPPVQVSEVDR